MFREKFVISLEDEESIELIEKHCEVIYKSPIMKLVIVNTNHTKEFLSKITGVKKVEESIVGKLPKRQSNKRRIWMI